MEMQNIGETEVIVERVEAEQKKRPWLWLTTVRWC